MTKNSKLDSYLGFAAKARKLCAGYNTCIYQIEKIKLLIITEEISENSRKKLIALAEKNKVEYRIYGDARQIAHMTGNDGKSIFGITDPGFAKVILEEIDKGKAPDKEVF